MTTESLGGRTGTAARTAGHGSAGARLEITGMWSDRVRSYVRERTDAGADAHVERRGGRTYLVLAPE